MSHPPTYYIPYKDVQPQNLFRLDHDSICEFKRVATYHTLKVGWRTSKNATWGYHEPKLDYESTKDYIIAFYPGRVDACYVDEEKVHDQEGDFYGSWITSDITGPFKGRLVTED